MEELVVIDGCGNPELKKCFDCDLEKAGGNLEHCGMCEEGWQRALGKLYDLEKNLGKDISMDRLRELVKADREGRCVVLPCKVGDKVFQQNGVDIFESQVKKIIYDCGHFAFDEETIGERVFLTRESAEAALKGEQA